jgi:hypothetical protein
MGIAWNLPAARQKIGISCQINLIRKMLLSLMMLGSRKCRDTAFLIKNTATYHMVVKIRPKLFNPQHHMPASKRQTEKFWSEPMDM